MHMSRRSGWLMLWGVVWIGLGLAYTDAPQQASLPIYAVIPMAWQGWSWVAIGLVSITSAVIPRFPRSVGFALDMLPPFLWALGYAVVWFASWREIGWQGVLVWGAITGAVVLSAGDAEVRG